MSASGRLLLGFGLVFAAAVILLGGALAVRPSAAAPPDPAHVTVVQSDDSIARELELRRQQVRERVVRRLTDPESGPVRPRLRTTDAPDELELELVNTAERPLRLWHPAMGLVYHVTLVLRDADGRLMTFLRWSRMTSMPVL